MAIEDKHKGAVSGSSAHDDVEDSEHEDGNVDGQALGGASGMFSSLSENSVNTFSVKLQS